MNNAPIITNYPRRLSDPRPAAAHKQPAPRRVLGELGQPGDVFCHLGPNWYASIMGTGIVANAAALLPVHTAALHAFALGVWVLAATLLVGLTLATAVHWLLHTETARGHHRDPATAPFYGAPPMAMLTVGAGALLVGRDLIGLSAAITVDEILWTLGTLTGLASTILIPYLMFTHLDLEQKDTLAAWLMPIVPPTLWIVVGPLGQSITAVGLLGNAAHAVMPEPYSA